jgi:hypothetical protein
VRRGIAAAWWLTTAREQVAGGSQRVAILRHGRRARAGSARLLLLELVVPPGHQPSLSERSDLHMLALLVGHERRQDEYRALLAPASLELTRAVTIGVPRSVIGAVPRSCPGGAARPVVPGWQRAADRVAPGASSMRGHELSDR